jgi:hypothetical protein
MDGWLAGKVDTDRVKRRNYDFRRDVRVGRAPLPVLLYNLDDIERVREFFILTLTFFLLGHVSSQQSPTI